MGNNFKRTAAALAVAAAAFAIDATSSLTARAAESCGIEHNNELKADILDDGSALSDGKYYLEAPLTLSEEIKITGTVTICLNGQKITANGSRVFYVSGGTLTLCDCQENGEITGKISGADGSDNWGGAVYIDNNGTFAMNGGKISGSSAERGGGVYVNKGKFTMTGGEISKNTASEQGGGVFVNDDSTFTMSGGTISENTVTGTADVDGGGGVYTAGEFTMNGSAEISGNNATNRYGGGVLVSGSKARFTLENSATISDNKANTYGGGVYVSSQGNVEMKGGAISGNEAVSGGGGISTGGGNFKMSNGEISRNTSPKGGGAYLGSGTFTLSGSGELSSNTATSDGGGVYMGGGGFNMTGGTLSENDATSNGGGVFLNNGDFNMSGGAITNNTASKYGRGVYFAKTSTASSMILSGKVTITSEPKDDGTKSNVFLADGKTITIGSNFSANEQIGIHPENRLETCRDKVTAATFDGTAANSKLRYFKADIDTESVIYENGVIRLVGEHSFKEEWATNDNDHWHECENCTNKIDSAKHIWGEGVRTKEPTLTEPGVIEYECTECHYKKTSPIRINSPSSSSGSSGSSGNKITSSDEDNSVMSAPPNPPTGHRAGAPAALAIIALAAVLTRKRR